MAHPTCDTCWGSHGCDLRVGHEGPHRCGPKNDPCSYCDDNAPTKDGRVRLVNIVTGAHIPVTMDVYNSHQTPQERAYWATFDKED